MFDLDRIFVGGDGKGDLEIIKKDDINNDKTGTNITFEENRYENST